MSWLDSVITWLSPSWGQKRALARLMTRHYEAAAGGRRTDGWSRRTTDANSAASGIVLSHLRTQARDLVRNNPWAANGLRLIANDAVGWGIRPKATGPAAKRIAQLWKLWAETTQCDAAGRLNFYGLQWLAMRSVAESGEVLIRRRMRRPGDGLAVPMQLQILEADYIDTNKDGMKGEAGGDIIQGVEFDQIGRRAAYWLYDQHPGGRSIIAPQSKRVPADSVLHVFDVARPGQVRGPSWFAPVDVRLHEFDELEDATLMKQKIASCLAAFVTDLDGSGQPLGGAGTDAKGMPTDSLEPGMILNLPMGKTVEFNNPPQASDYPAYSTTVLHGIAAGLGVTYEALTGDYSQVNYSSARMGANAAAANVHHWRWNMLIPQLCEPAWQWMLGAIELTGEPVGKEPAQWTPPPARQLDPDKEGAATTKAVRSGQMTPDEMIREQGLDPDEHWEEYAKSFKRLDRLGITIDSDARKTSGAGQLQAPAPSKPASKPDEGDDEDGDEGDDNAGESSGDA